MPADPPPGSVTAEGPRGRSTLGRWLAWLLGLAALAAVVVIATHISEEHAFARMIEQAQPWWIAVAFALQTTTYFALGQVWRTVARVARQPLGLAPAARVAVAKLFVDQTLPSLGVSGSVLLASALERRGFSRPIVAATVVIELASYYFAYALGLALAVAIASAEGHATAIVVAPALAFVAIAIGIGAGAIALSRAQRLPRLPGLRRVEHWLTSAERDLTGDARLLARTTTWELTIIALDGATMWTLLRAVGAHAPIAGVYASFMIASLARTISIMPGGLGVFEAVSVVALNQLGVPLAASLSATLLFRGLSYWLPMIPGFIASRRLR